VALAFIGISLIIWTILTLSLDSLNIGSTLSSCLRRLTRRNVKKQKNNKESLGQLHPENCDYNFTLPEDYFQSTKGSSGYRSTIISDSVKEDEEILRERPNIKQEDGIDNHLDHNLQEDTLKK